MFILFCFVLQNSLFFNHFKFYDMKKNLFSLIIVPIISIALVSLSFTTKPDVSTFNIPDDMTESIMTTYHSYHCPVDQGNGCSYEISPYEPDCELQTSCSGGYKNFEKALHKYYTPAQIYYMESAHQPITDQRLKDALKADGFPTQ